MPHSRRLHFRGHTRIARRPAQASLVLLLSLPVMLLAMALAIFAAELVETRTQMRNATDAAALAGVQTFVDDRLLHADPNLMSQLLQNARVNAQTYAQNNLVFAQGLQLDANTANDQDGDIVVGSLTYPRSKNFILPDLNSSNNLQLRALNTMRVTGQRTQNRQTPLLLHNGPLLALMPNDAAAASTATIDRDAIGFRPMGQQPLPMVPIALFSEPITPPRHSWEYQVERRRGGDNYKIINNGSTLVVQSGPDGLHEMEPHLGNSNQGQNQGNGSGVNLNLELRNGKFSCCLLQFGTSDMSRVAQQIVLGVSATDLSSQGGQLVLNTTNPLIVPGTPWSPPPNSDAVEQLQSALNQLRSTAEARVWPLFTSFDTESGNPVISGFVAARVVAVRATQPGKGLTFAVQPCMMSTATAVTLSDGQTGNVDISSLRGGNAKLPNPYICKVRLVE